MMKMKTIKKMKLVVCQIVVSGSLFLSACSVYAKEGGEQLSLTASETVQGMMESMKTLDLDTFNVCTDNYIQTEYNVIGVPVRNEYRVFSELLQPGLKLGKRKEKYEFHHKLAEKMMENLTWEIKSVEEDNDKAEIVMEITNLDMNDVMGAYEMHIMEKMIEGEGTGVGEMIKELLSIADADGSLIALMESGDQEANCTLEVTATAYRKDGAWIIHLDDELINACMGNINGEE